VTGEPLVLLSYEVKGLAKVILIRYSYNGTQMGSRGTVYGPPNNAINSDLEFSDLEGLSYSVMKN